jgi:hypothetical protein
MATTTIARAEIASGAIALTASTVDTVTFTSTVGQIEVVNVDGAAAIYFTVDGSTPTVGGKGTFVVPAAIGSRTVRAVADTTTVTAGQAPGVSKVVKLISSGTPTYIVQDGS